VYVERRIIDSQSIVSCLNWFYIYADAYGFVACIYWRHCVYIICCVLHICLVINLISFPTRTIGLIPGCPNGAIACLFGAGLGLTSK
jgi:hypothetical protein